MTVLRGTRVILRTATEDDVGALVRIRSAAEIRERWGGDDIDGEIREALADPELELMAIELDGDVVGAIQWSEEADPMYRHANMDIFVAPSEHGRGVGTDTVRTLARHLIADVGHHRIVIDPAADNTAAIRCYSKAGFRPVGVMRRYELGPDGTWHDGLLMDLLADDLID